MAVPKKKTSHSRGGKRRSHNALKPVGLSTCPNCQEPKVPHRICPHCGWYKNREIVDVNT
jgi:large subunit ribosomal protein L32